VKNFLILGALGALGLVTLGACATAQPPSELVDARAAYQRASTGPAAQLNPADLHTAKETLDVAEKSFADNGGSDKTKNAAYTAERRVEIAEVRANIIATQREKDQMIAQANANQANALTNTTAALGRTKEQLEAERAALATETQRRIDADKRAKEAADNLAKFASVKQEPRGMVITLSGAVLFATNKSELLPAAQTKLQEVAKALTQQDKDSHIIVEGHTDSQGSDDLNQALSQRRAESVKNYLTSQGIAADRLTATGFGKTRPIADNASPEGRADNRRVEIVVQPASGGTSSMGR
jgi:outer membrane protein OmpA-like peptidoglycan-associated protein